MNTKHILPMLLVSLALATIGGAQDKQPTDAEKASKTLTDAYVAAFNKGDTKALGAMYAEDAEYTNEDGDIVIGRPAVVEGLTKFFRENKGAKLGVKVESARFLTPDVLVDAARKRGCSCVCPHRRFRRGP